MATDCTGPREPIAIVGIGCRFPGAANDPASLWRVLRDGVDAVREIPADRRELGADPCLASRAGGFLDGIDRFDAAFFGISPREASRIDPQQRLLLETAWEAFEDAHEPVAELAGSNTGVFVGLWLSDYEASMFADPSAVDFHMTTGTGRYSASGRLSYTFGFHGPSLTVDTACSSSLVATHLACRSLWAGECELALAGGANVILQSQITTAYAGAGMLSHPDGRCRFGDARANGYVRSEGAGVVALKLLANAIADGNPIHAVILGSAVNHGGRASGDLAAPAIDGQEDLIRRAWADAGLEAGEAAFVEAHGTGTRAGDPVELMALGRALAAGSSTTDAPCLVGSVKTNLGHTEGAAGIAGLIKAALSLEHGEYPPSLHLEQPNPAVPWDALPLAIPTRPTDISPGKPAGVSAFGIAGTNAHVVLGPPPARAANRGTCSPSPVILPLSARDPAALRAAGAAYRALVGEADAGFLSDVCSSAASGRDHHDHRLAVSGRSSQEIADRLGSFLRGEPAPGLAIGERFTGERHVVFVFPGQGSQWPGMGSELFAHEPAFRREIERCEEAMRPFVDWSLAEQLGADSGSAANRLDGIDVVQPVLLAVELALAALWRSWGIEPDAVVGHSMGEIAAARVAGVLTLEDAMRIVCTRSRLLRDISGTGAMAVVELSASDAEAALADHRDRLSVAVSNSPRSSVLAGDPETLGRVLDVLEASGVYCRRVDVDVASHSPQVDPLLPTLSDELSGIQPRSGAVPMYSTVLAEPLDGLECDERYWTENLRRPVRFAETTERLVADGHEVFVELSPHPLLVASIRESLGRSGPRGLAVGSLRRGEPEREHLLDSLGALYTRGCTPDWKALYPGSTRPVRLPAYPWQRERYWIDSAASDGSGSRAGSEAPASSYQSIADGTHVWEAVWSAESIPYLTDHRVHGTLVVPATTLIIAVLDAAAQALGPAPHQLEDVEFREALVLDDVGGRIVQIVASQGMPGVWTFELFSRQPPSEAWTLHACGKIHQARTCDVASIDTAATGRPITSEEHYAGMAGRGLDYGRAFQTVGEGSVADGEATAALRLAGGVTPEAHDLHPTLLDGAFQLLESLLPPEVAYLPSRLGVFRPLGAGTPGGTLRASAVLGADGVSGDIVIAAASGAPVAEVRDLRFEPLERGRDPLGGLLHHVRWISREAEPPGDASGAWLLVGDPGSAATALSARLEAAGASCRLAGYGDIDSQLADARGVAWFTPTGSTGDDACCAELARLAHRLGQAGKPPRLFVITRASQPAGPGVTASQAAPWGLGAVIANEHPELCCVRIDLGSDASGAELDSLLTEVLQPFAEDQVALRGASRLVPRLAPASGPARRATLVEPEPGENYLLELPKPGSLDELCLRAAGRRAPGAGEIEIAVHATGLNFRDVMTAMDLMPGLGKREWPALGIECAGIVTAVGEGVEDLLPGDEVVALSPDFERIGLFSAYATVPVELVAPKPRRLSFEEAASLPAVFLTARYALCELARLRSGERVLVHSAAGGVGLAALQIARLAGAEVLATAGSAEKRDYLRSLGIDHVMDSRSLAFGAEALAATGGEGVDVVLNSLAGKAIQTGLESLAPYGRFLELGKRDVYGGSRIGLEPFRRNLSFFAVDLARLVAERPAYVGELLRETIDRFETGELTASPVEPFAAGDAASAFHRMARADHVGKIVVRFAGEPVRVERADPASLDPDAAYLVTGGLGALGLVSARWLVENGARRLVLLGRTEPRPEACDAVRELEAGGVEVQIVQVDVADREDLGRALAATVRRPLRGVVHAAGILDDALLGDLTPERVESVLAPKVAGARNLDVLTRDEPLDFFVLFSSAAALLGTPSQGSYAAANAFLDALAHERREAGLPALSIDWGPWSAVGLAAAAANRGERLAARGLGSIRPDEGAAALSTLVETGATQVAVLRLEPERWIEAHPAAGRTGFLSDLQAASRVSGAVGTDLRAAALAAEAGRQRRDVLETHVREDVARVLRLSPARVPLDRPLKELGLDSLMTLELRNRLEGSTGCRLSATVFFNYPTVGALAGYLGGALGIPLDDGSAPAPSAADELANLSEGDLSALLADELTRARDVLEDARER